MFSISANITGYFLRRLPQHLLTLGLVLAVLAGPGPVSAQDLGRVSGYLRDGGSGEPLRYANVVLEGTALGAASDVHGRYLIMDIPPGNYRLKVMMLGYATKVQELVMPPGADLGLDRRGHPELLSSRPLPLDRNSAQPGLRGLLLLQHAHAGRAAVQSP